MSQRFNSGGPIAICALAAVTCFAQQNPNTQVVHLDQTPIYRVTVVSRTAKAINYRHRSGATKIDFRGTALLPEAKGQAKVESKQGYIEIEVEFDKLQPAGQFGPEYLTYVLWAVTPEGRAKNLGEILLNGVRSKLDVTTELQAFGLIVTAEPYFAVTQPSDVVVMENIIRTDTLGKVEEIDAKYELLQRGQYTMNVAPADVRSRAVRVESKTPIEIFEARNALQIAQWAGADRYANETYVKATGLMQQAEDYLNRKKTERKPAIMTAREAVQTAEDARLIAVKRIEEERVQKEKQAAAEREAAATAEAESQAQQRQRAEAERRAAEQARASAEQATATAQRAQADAERVRREAEMAADRAAREREAAETARAAALAQQQAAMSEAEKARAAALESDRLRQQAETDKQQLRQQLLQQFNMILETRNTARGLIVNMSDVLFDTGRYTLRPAAREKLAKISGIILGHPSLKLEVEGHTDSVGGEAYNQTLSEKRADGVREYLVQQGIPGNMVTARGFGKTMPVASNDNAAGRQQNRRVELVVSGDVIGTPLTGTR